MPPEQSGDFVTNVESRDSRVQSSEAPGLRLSETHGNACRADVREEIKLQARAELDRRSLEYIHANGLTGIPNDQVEQIGRQLLQQG